MDGIVLKSTPYQEDGKILKIFTKEVGLISVIIKKLKSKASYFQTVTSPLARGEFLFTKNQSDLFSLKDATLLDAYLEIRNNFEKLDAACKILKALLLSQYPEKSSPLLYLLTINYLKSIQTFQNPLILTTSFKMKLLNFEGLFPERKEDFLAELSEDEWLNLECLCHAKKFEHLETITFTTSLEKKADDLFMSKIERI